jgi:predicted RNase H-like nuclease
MSAILGIDAAWTPKGSSGIALIRKTGSRQWECVAVEAGYSAFLRHSNQPFAARLDGRIPAREIVQVAEQLAKTSVSLVVADIPLSRNPITGPRFADIEIGKRFGAKGCAAHSPNSIRPGPVSEHFREGFEECGFSLTTRADHIPHRALIETYPHPVLLSLLNADYRVRYKVDKTAKYWRGADIPTRRANLLGVLREIRDKLSESIHEISLEVPESSETFSGLKPIEDKIDALVCAWVGIQVLDGKAGPIGDESAAIWLPRGPA